MIKIQSLAKMAIIALMVLLQACSSVPTKHKSSGGKSTTSSSGHVDSDEDGPPLVDRDVSDIPNAEPRLEPLSRYGNPPVYTALGNRYKVKTSSKNYHAEGTASWYGRKFHGQRTSSGEPYDMFGMTAAHRDLPLPTYAQVKNLHNGKEVIVKINDRGPFAHNRIIDLSYAAAKKLGIHQTGTAKVSVTAIDPIAWHKQQKGLLAKNSTKKSGTKSKPTQLAQADKAKKGKGKANKKSAQKTSTVASNDKKLYIQLGAFNEEMNALELAKKASTFTQALNNVNVHVMPHANADKSLYKVRVGPIKNKEQAQKLQKKLVALNQQAPAKIVYE